MRKGEFTKIEDFIRVGNGYGNKTVKDIADKEWQESLGLLRARKTLLERYRTEVREVIIAVLEKDEYRDKYYGYVCHVLGAMIEDPGFDLDGTSFQAVVRDAAQKAFATVHGEISDFLHTLFDDIGSDLEKTPQ
jgi:hypothetical protein